MTLLENFLKNKKVHRTLTTKPGEEGFSLVELVVVIAVLAILSAVAIPAFVGVQANARASAIKNGLANGVKECVIRASDGQTTTHTAVNSFPGNYNGYNVGPASGSGGGNTCYAATAAAAVAGDSDFTIVLNPQTGAVAKSCTVNTAPGCDAGSW